MSGAVWQFSSALGCPLQRCEVDSGDEELCLRHGRPLTACLGANNRSSAPAELRLERCSGGPPLSAADVVLFVERRVWTPDDRPFQPEWVRLLVTKEHTVLRLCRHQLPAPFIAAELAHQQRALSERRTVPLGAWFIYDQFPHLCSRQQQLERTRASPKRRNVFKQLSQWCGRSARRFWPCVRRWRGPRIIGR